MKKIGSRIAPLALALFLVLTLSAHVGTLDAFFVGQAGPYRVQVTVRPPGVVPGLAQITIRVDGGAMVTRVTTQAAQWNVGTRGAPAPDPAVRVPGDSALWSSQLWFMTRGSYAVNVALEGPSGLGAVTIPVSNIATQKLGMTPSLGLILGGLALFLFVGFVSLVGAASRESVLDPGQAPSESRRRGSRIAMGVAGVVLALALTGGRAWWNSVDAAYARRLFKPITTSAEAARASDGASRAIRLTITDSAFLQGQLTPFVPDHGKLMHLFLVSESTPGAIAHLHPLATDSATFESKLGHAPAGRYMYFADVVHESGFAQTMTGTVVLPAPGTNDLAVSDPDDASYAGPAEVGDRQVLSDSAVVEWERPAVVRSGADILLRFTVREKDGTVATLLPYLGMPGHAIVARDDGSVFAHLHSNGSFSMAALQVLSAIERGDTIASLRAGAPRPRLDTSATTAAHAQHLSASGQLEFPFAFPKAGSYTVWVQFRRGVVVQTAAFRLTVE